MFKIFAKIGHHFLMNNCIIYKYLTNCLLNSPGARVTNSAAQKRLQAGAKFDLCFEKGGGLYQLFRKLENFSLCFDDAIYGNSLPIPAKKGQRFTIFGRLKYSPHQDGFPDS